MKNFVCIPKSLPRSFSEDYTPSYHGFYCRDSNVSEAWDATKTVLKTIPFYAEVGYGRYRISPHPLVSYNYRGCRAVVVVTENFSVLGHMLPQQSAALFIDDVVQKLGIAVPSLKALVIGGYNPQVISKYLIRCGIDVLGCFQDYDSPCGYYPPDTKKDIITKPQDGLIEIITSRGVQSVSLHDPRNPFE